MGNYGVSLLLLLLSLSSSLAMAVPLPHKQPASTSSGAQINSNSVLVALLDSHYTELAELVEKALLLPTLEAAVGTHNVTIFAPQNQALERDLDPEFKRFLLEPRNLKSLQTLLLFHVLPARISTSNWPSHHPTLCPNHPLSLHTKFSHANQTPSHFVDLAAVLRPDDIVKPDGIIHGIERLLIPRSVQQHFNHRRNLQSISAVKPQGAPAVDTRTHRLKKPSLAAQVPAGAPPALPIYDAMAPGSSLAPAPAPGPGGPKAHFDGESHVKDFIHTLLHYGGYSEMADILVNLTSLGAEIGKLVSEGYVVTILAPNDEAMAQLTTDQLSEPGAPERIIYYHIIPEYQTEESMYNAVRRFGKVKFQTLLASLQLTAVEADGSVRFGKTAYLFDPDIYTDGRISVQGIDSVMFPEEEEEKEGGKPTTSTTTTTTTSKPALKKAVKQRRGKLLEVACSMLGAVGQDSHFTSCQ